MKRIITIGREFGSGGRELGRRLSEQMHIAYYDQEIITEIAKRTAMSEEYVRQITESSPIPSFPITVGHSFCPVPNPMFQQCLSVYTEQHKLLKELAGKSDCIIVGRCADYILRDAQPFRIFVYADTASKLRRCMERKPENENLSEAQVKRRIAEIDRGRAKYYQFFSDRKWGAKENYDLLVNTSNADIKKLSAALCGYLQNLYKYKEQLPYIKNQKEDAEK